MKKSTSKFLAILFAVIATSVMYPQKSSAQQSSVSFRMFYDQLSPYGEWVDYPDYGYVWIPDAGSDFYPYATEGHWVLTNYGWTWVSNYNWGWAAFHYGRWGYDNYYGWFWVPGNEWGPSWVVWRRAQGYYGWAPLEPGISINVSFSRDYDRHNTHWIFVRDRDFERHDINRYSVNRNDYPRIIQNSTVINKTYIDNSRHTTYISGPAREEIQKVTGRRISPVDVRDDNKPGQEIRNGQLRIYRPEVSGSNDRTIAPSRVTNLKDVKRPSERKAAPQPRNINQQNDNNNRAQPSRRGDKMNDKAEPARTREQDNKNRRQPNNVDPKDNNLNKENRNQPRNVSPDTKERQQQKSKNGRNPTPKDSKDDKDKNRAE